MKTIKGKVLELVSKQGTISRKQLQFNIFKAQGKKGVEAVTYRQGYYCDGIQKWVRDGLLTQPKEGFFKIGAMGKKYLENPQHANALIKIKEYKDRVDSLKRTIDSYKEEVSKFREIEYIVNYR